MKKHNITLQEIEKDSRLQKELITELTNDSYCLSSFYYQQYKYIYLLYPFYCIETVIEIDQKRVEDIDDIMFGIRYVNSKNNKEMPDRDVFRVAIQRLMRRITYKGRKLTRNGYETAGRLFKGGFEI